MAVSYFSTVIEQSIGRVWPVIRDFGAYSWAGKDCQARIEGDRPGDCVGCVRIIGEDGLRQRLLAHSDIDHSYTYEFDGSSPFPIEGYRATIHLAPILDGNRTFAEWSAIFDCAPEEREELTSFFTNSFSTWLTSLGTIMQSAESTAAH